MRISANTQRRRLKIGLPHNSTHDPGREVVQDAVQKNYDFSPKVKHWLEEGQTLRALLRLKLGKEGNIANVKRTAKICGITHPLSYTRQEIWTMYNDCQKKMCRDAGRFDVVAEASFFGKTA